MFQIREQIKQFGINIYQFPECDSDEEEEFKNQDQILKVLLLTSPFLTCVFFAALSTFRLTVIVFFSSLCRTASRLQ